MRRECDDSEEEGHVHSIFSRWVLHSKLQNIVLRVFGAQVPVVNGEPSKVFARVMCGRTPSLAILYTPTVKSLSPFLLKASCYVKLNGPEEYDIGRKRNGFRGDNNEVRAIIERGRYKNI